jgi:ketosteroid isomerase-like protein
MKTILSLTLLSALLIAPAVSQAPQISPAMAAMADSERAFARAAGEKGIGPAFYEFFAEEGVGFNPHPARFRENYRKRTPPAERPPVSLDWWPVFGDVSAAGDLGFTTGPFEFKDFSPQKRPPFFGFYSSVWKKQADGTWRVMVDLGVDTPVPNPQLPRDQFAQAPLLATYKPVSGGSTSREDVMRMESEFRKIASERGLPEAYRTFLADQCRIHSNGRFPMTGKGAISEVFGSANPVATEWEALDGGVAASGDLGYTYGKYATKLVSAAGEKIVKGYFMRVWRHDARGAWKLTFDVTKPLPPDAK